VATTLSLRFDLKIAAPPSTGEMVVAEIDLAAPGIDASANGTLHVEFCVRPTQTVWDEADYRVRPAKFYDHPFARPPEFGSWKRVKVALNLGSPHVTVSLDADTVVDDAFGFPASSSNFSLAMGLIYSGNSNEALVHIDNIAVDWQ
jgi:hypothetical protein